MRYKDVSPDVATRHGAGRYLTVAIRDKPYVKITVTLFSSAYFYPNTDEKNGLKRDQFNTLLIDRKESALHTSVAPFATCKILKYGLAVSRHYSLSLTTLRLILSLTVTGKLTYFLYKDVRMVND